MPIDAKPVVYDAMHFFNAGVSFLRQHSWVICCALFAIYILREQVIQFYQKYFMGRRLITTPRSPQRLSRQEEMLKARERQQHLMDEQAKIAAKERAEKEEEEKNRKNHCVVPKKKKKKPPETPSSYNPLQPSASGTGRYRPARRTVRRG